MFDGMEMRHQGPCLENAKQLGMKHAHVIYIYIYGRRGGGGLLPEILKKETVKGQIRSPL